jgi:hypothetical protein
VKCVQSWLDRRAGPDASAEQVAAHLRDALAALWTRAHTSLGDVTLGAIFSRVVKTTKSKHPVLDRAGLRAGEGDGVGLDSEAAGSLSADELRRAAGEVLLEVLLVLGRLTGETLTPGLHAELDRHARDEEPHPRSPRSTKKGEGRR